MKKLLFIIAVLAICAGCVTEKRCERKFPPIFKIHDSISYTHEVHDSIIPGSTVHDTILKKDWEKIPAYYPVYREDPKSGLMIKMYKDSLGNIIAGCEEKDKIITKYKEQIANSHIQNNTQVITKKVTPKWVFLVIGAAGIIIILLALKLFWKKIAG